MASFDPYGMLSGATEDVALFTSDPVGNFNFVLTVEGVYDIPLKSVRAFQKVNQYEKIREGGVNDYVHLKRAPIQDAHTIQFERYMSASLFDPLANGAELAIPLILWIKRSANNDYKKNLQEKEKDVTKDLKSDTSSVRLYIFTGATVMSKEYGALDAEHSALCTEVVTVGYKELYIVPNLYTFFGGGTDEKSIGKMGELEVDNGTRDDFLKAQKKAHDDAVAANKKKAEEAEKKEQAAIKKAENYRKQFEKPKAETPKTEEDKDNESGAGEGSGDSKGDGKSDSKGAGGGDSKGDGKSDSKGSGDGKGDGKGQAGKGSGLR